MTRLILAFIAAALCTVAIANSYPSDDFERMLPEKFYALARDAGRAYQDKKFDDAFRLFQRAACAGDKTAQAAIGRMYLLGQGTRHSDLTGYAWLAVATERMFPAYQSLVEKLHDAMTPEQLKLASARAEEIKQHYGFAATNVSCELASSTGTASNLKDVLVCSLPKEGSQVLAHRCVDGVPH